MIDLSDPKTSARQAGLRYVTDSMPGLRRKGSGKNFRYFSPDGKVVRDPGEIRRIRAMVIPPAWQEVWICPWENGHLQATGRDARGRKQNRYHPLWREARDETKYNRMFAFGKVLPKIRRKVLRDLRQRGLSKTKVLAAVVRLLETSLIRVGNEEYARENRSFGLTTMRDKHVEISGSALRFNFRGKSGKEHTVDLRDPRLARIVKACQDIPGQELFQYLNEEGQREQIDSEDVNEYLREISGSDFTAKDFRTWAGTILAAMALQEFAQFDSEAQARQNIVRAIEQVAKRLGNTPSICRKCYIHPLILDAYLDGSMVETLKQRAESQMVHSLKHLSPEEAAVLGMLRQRLASEQRKRKTGAVPPK